MAFQTVKSERSFYTNDIRAQWSQRLVGIHKMDECTALLRDFRTRHIGPDRKSYRLYNDALWIENAIEQRLAQLKAVELNDEALRDTCTTGESAATVCTAWARRLDSTDDYRTLEALSVEYRRNYKPPIMPVNAWLHAERAHVAKLMTLRSRRRPWGTLEELRAERGAKLVGGRNLPTHQVTIRFESGEPLSFPCSEQEDVISAALHEQIILLAQCREGQCSTCKATCASGKLQLGAGVNVYSLPPEEQEAGMVLLCQTFPRSNLVIDVPCSREMVSIAAATGSDSLVRIHTFDKCTPSIHRLVVEHLNPKTKRPRELGFTPGQYVNILLPGTDQWRTFSMASPPREDGLVEFFVKEIPGGLFSERFWRAAHVGLELTLQGPYGMFHINRASRHRRIFVAGGVGVAPILSMLRQARKAGDTTPSALVLTVSDEDAQLCTAELRELESTLTGLVVDRFITSNGLLNDAANARVLAHLSEADPADVYVCGSDELVSAGEALCRNAGVKSRQVYAERFLPTGSFRLFT